VPKLPEFAKRISKFCGNYENLLSPIPVLVIAQILIGNIWATLSLFLLSLVLNRALLITKRCLLIQLGVNRFVSWMFPRVSYGPDWLDLIVFGFGKSEKEATLYIFGIWFEDFLPLKVRKLARDPRLTVLFIWNIFFKKEKSATKE